MYYEGTRLLSQKDINGQTPELFLCTTNRTGGKTTYYGRWCVNCFNKGKGQFISLYRFKDELKDCANTFYKDIGSLFFPNTTMRSKMMNDGAYAEMYIDDTLVGYGVAINSADKIKKVSHVFSRVNRIWFDEFQSETNHYCSDEVKKFRSIHTSVARGQGKQVRYVPVVCTANPVSILNPYYVALGISPRLTKDTKFLRGDGFVLEQGYNESAANAQKESGFNRAFGEDKYNAYSAQGLYLNDNLAFIGKPEGKGRYLATLRYNGREYALREYAVQGIIYCDDHPDQTYPIKLSVTTEDHNINYVMLNRYKLFIDNMRFYFDKGCFRFKDLPCKEALMSALSY